MIAPTIAEFKAQFTRDFPYGTTNDTVMDSDIATAIQGASFNINESLFDTQDNFVFAYNYLVAHCLVQNIRASTQGLAGVYTWLESSKAVGSVSQVHLIPHYIMNNPIIAMISKTTYGAKYLELILPRMIGNMQSAEGSTQP
jgi:hypothetical protein